jgi:DNA-binding MarR family transcriptional regulator
MEMTVPVETLGFLVKMTQHTQTKTVDKALAPFEITVVGWAALKRIAENPGASQHALAIMTFNSDQAFGTLAQRLARLDMIERVEGPGRAVIHSLTPKGQLTLNKCDRLVRRTLGKLYASLSEGEQDQLGRLLKKALGAGH